MMPRLPRTTLTVSILILVCLVPLGSTQHKQSGFDALRQWLAGLLQPKQGGASLESQLRCLAAAQAVAAAQAQRDAALAQAQAVASAQVQNGQAVAIVHSHHGQNGHSVASVQIHHGGDGAANVQVQAVSRAGPNGQPGQSQVIIIHPEPATEAPAPPNVDTRDYVEDERDYQNLLDMLRKEAELKPANYVADDVSLEEIARLIDAAPAGSSSTISPDDIKNADECPICLNSMANSDITMPQCKHEFHTKCLESWMEHGKGDEASKCPLCRAKIIRTRQVQRKSN